MKALSPYQHLGCALRTMVRETHPTNFVLTQAATLVVILAALLLHAPSVRAHPLGNLGISHHSALHIEPDRIEVRYTLDYAEIPTFQESQKHRFVAQVGHPTLRTYLKGLSERLKQGLTLKLNQKTVAVDLILPCDATFPAGAAGMPTMRVACRYRVTLPLGEASFEMHYQDANYPQRSGWKEVTLQGSAGVVVIEQSVPSKDRSAQLTQYPSGLLKAPPQVLHAQAVFKTSAHLSTAK